MKTDPAPQTGRDILLISTADWDNPFWTNKQHVAVELARQGRRVLYVESAGLLAPRQVRPGLWVWSPPTLPWQGSGAVRRVNRLALRLGLAWAMHRIGLAAKTLWTYSPMTTALYDLTRFEQVVYHAVDDIAAQPGMPADVIERAEAALVRRADVVFATSPDLQARHAASGARRCVFLPNVADWDHFSTAMDPATQIPHDLAVIPEPRVGFVGAISGYKLDFALLRAVAQARPDYSFVLIGRVGEGEPRTDATLLRGVANLHLLGPRPYGALPAYLAGVQAAILPSATNRYTRAMFPMKFFEYLAAGLAVVTTPLPALEPFTHLAITAPPEPQAFGAAIGIALSGGGPSLDVRLEAARAHTYASRTREMLAALESLDR